MAPLGGAAGRFADAAQQALQKSRAEQAAAQAAAQQAQAAAQQAQAAAATAQQPVPDTSYSPSVQPAKKSRQFRLSTTTAIIIITIAALAIAGTAMMIDPKYKDNKEKHIIITHSIFAALAGLITLVLTYRIRFLKHWAFLFFIVMAQIIWVCFQGYTWGWKKNRFPKTGPLTWNTPEREAEKISDRTISTYKEFQSSNTGEQNYQNTKWYAFMHFTKNYYIDSLGTKKYIDYSPDQFKELTNTEKQDIISFIELPDQFPQSVRTDDPDTTDIDETITTNDLKKLQGYTLKIEDVVEIDGGSKSIPEFVDENEFKSSTTIQAPKLLELRKNVTISIMASIAADFALVVFFMTFNGKKKQTANYQAVNNQPFSM